MNLYNYYDILTCECTGKEHKKSYGNNDKNTEPESFTAIEDDKCLSCGKKFKFKERRLISDVKVK
jgi:hypothetical protein